ncbi:thermostable phytase [Zopfia rhizophila CBS 207.26]|uniref:Thermostable phytase n=1 Tax=Zopfia rhizophila CBS 207.26 TaxID=1314779 RepID=A0A6A6E3B8_9PEZI|nr:thermostable phytase [Zopfia rhizophila CBS 207.26]
MRFFKLAILFGLANVALIQARDANITLVPAATGFEADNTAFYYSSLPLLLTNDGGAASGGFRVFSVGNSTSLTQRAHEKTGRSKVVVPVYDASERDVFVTIAAPDSIMRVFDADSIKEIPEARKKVLGDWSSLCTWQSSKSGNRYLFLFGKQQIVQFLVRSQDEDIEILEVQTFGVPIEAEFCATSLKGVVYFSGEDRPLYSFKADETTSAPEITTINEDVEIAGLATYTSNSTVYLFLAHDESVDVYDEQFAQVGTISLLGIQDLSIEAGLSLYQAQAPGYPSGAIALAFEGEEGTGIALGSLEEALPSLGITLNTKFNPKNTSCKDCEEAICDSCSKNGFCNAGGEDGSCECFAGFAGSSCNEHVCKNDCSSHGTCVGPNTCKCDDKWGGPDCSFAEVEPRYETDANGGDGDDPAIWVHPSSPEQSKIVTTTKSEEGAGLAIFDLKGQFLQHLLAEEPNNVDIIYGFKVGNRTIDLAFAACRGDNTLCLFEVNSTGLLNPISGGIQPTEPNYEVYGSCTFRSHKTGKQYLFVNSKEALYLQYELTSTANGTLQTQLMRSFTGGSGGQVEGCVSDDEAGYLFLGEEPEGIWRYDAEPDAPSTGLQIAKVGDGKLSADVEGLTLIPGKDGINGFLFVSSQGISAYLVYQRALPHKYVMTFTIVDNEKGMVDHVSNTDGIAAVGNKLNADFPSGLFVTHDDANELSEGGTASEASFKLVSLADILGEERIHSLGY